jgi:hypothetical protein
MPFKKGQSGNPSGRPKGIKDRRVALREKLEPHAGELLDIVVTYAKAGDPTAMRLVMERLVPPIKEDRIQVTIPTINSADDCVTAQAAIVQAVAAGELLPSEGQTMSGLIEAQRKAYETHEFSKRLEAIETALQQRGH